MKKYTADGITKAMRSLFEKKGKKLSIQFYPLYSKFHDIWEPNNEDEVYRCIEELVASFNSSLLKNYGSGEVLPEYWNAETGCIDVGMQKEDDIYRIFIEFKHGEYKYI